MRLLAIQESVKVLILDWKRLLYWQHTQMQKQLDPQELVAKHLLWLYESFCAFEVKFSPLKNAQGSTLDWNFHLFYKTKIEKNINWIPKS